MIDPVSSAIASLNIGALTWLSVFLDSTTWWLFLFLAVLIYLVYPKARNNKLRIAAFAAALALTGMLALAAKYAYAHPRPCVIAPELLKLEQCPWDYSFPSMHTAYAFVYVGASLGTSIFPLFFLIALAVAFSRIYLGVHTIGDIAGGVVIALAAYYVIEGLLRNSFPAMVTESERKKAEKMKKGGAHLEVRRDLAHITYGTILLGVVYFFGRSDAQLLILAALFLGMIAMHFRMKHKPAPIIDALFDLLERPMVMPAKGAFMYTVGVLLALSFIENLNAAMAVIAILAWGDGMATIAGEILGRQRLPFNRNKSIAGTLAFFLFGGLAAFPFLGLQAFLFSFVCAIVEAIDFKVDDNFAVPLAGVILAALV